MLVTTFEMDNLDCTKINAHFQKCIAYLWKGLIDEWKHKLLAPPLLLMLVKKLMAMFHTQSLHHSCLHQCSTDNKLGILVEAQPSTQSIWPWSPTRLGIRPQYLGLHNKYNLGHYGISAASRHKLAFTSRHYSLFTAT